jgi:hypothetical protein
MDGIPSAANRKPREIASPVAWCGLLMLSAIIALLGPPARVGSSNDQVPAASPLAIETNNYPRLSLVNYPGGGDWRKLEKYMAFSLSGGSIRMVSQVKADVQSKGRSITALRYFPARAYQNDQNSIPFAEIYPGHWLFVAGTTTTGFVSGAETTIPVANTEPFRGLVGYFAMIWDATVGEPSLTPDDPAFWGNAEHVRITSVGSNSITVQRGYDGSSRQFSAGLTREHRAGSRIAMHALGAGKVADIWALNQSTYAPRDANGKQLNELMGLWLGHHFNDLYVSATRKYRHFPGAFDGILFDTTNYTLKGVTGGADVNNDTEADDGFVEAGRNSWGEGLDVMFATARQALGPGVPIVGGVIYTRGLTYLNGTQFEMFPDGRPRPTYDSWDGSLSRYSAWQGQAGMQLVNPNYNEILSRFGTAQYPACGPAMNGTDADFRLGLGSALLGNAYFNYDNGCFGDYWWDEYAVDLTNGEAVPLSAGVDAVATHTGYLGQPLGEPRRLLDLSSGPNLLTSGRWRIRAWRGAGANLRVSGSTVSASITGPGYKPRQLALRYVPISMEAGQEYTLTFWAKADNGRTAVDLGREVEVVLGAPGVVSGTTKEFITGGWREYAIDFVAPATTIDGFLEFRVGADVGDIVLDKVMLYQGASSLYRRDFENGIVIVNATWRTQTVDLEGTFRKIKGFQDPVFNDGAEVSSVTLASHDAVILLR